MEYVKFKKLIYQASYICEFKIESLHEPNIIPNFYSAKVSQYNYGETLFILCSINNEWALAKEVLYVNIEFIDDFNFTRKLNSIFGIKFLTKIELDGPFEKRFYMSNSDIKYWKPMTLGNGIYNWWD